LWGGTNHFWIIWRSDMETWLELRCVRWFKFTCSRWLCLNGWKSWLLPSSSKDCKKRHLKRIGVQVIWIQFLFNIEFIGMSYYQERCNMMMID
jgi:hypothetical protein